MVTSLSMVTRGNKTNNTTQRNEPDNLQDMSSFWLFDRPHPEEGRVERSALVRLASWLVP